MTIRVSHAAGAAGGLVAAGLLFVLHVSAARSTHEVRLTGNRFAPGEITVHAGDSLRFVNVGGGFHNIAFREDILSPDQRRLLDSVMPGREDFRAMAVVPLASPMLVNRDEVYAFQLPPLPPGRYDYFCAPHFAAGMKGTLIVAP